MPLIKESTATLRPDLTQALIEYDDAGATAKFIGEQILVPHPVPTKTGEFPIFKRENFLETPETHREPGGGYNRSALELDSRTFACETHGLEQTVDDEDAVNYARYLSLEAAAARTRYFQMLVAFERAVATTMATITAGGNAAVKWSTIASSTPLADIQTYADVICDAAGCSRADLTLIVSETDLRYLRTAAAILDVIKYTNPGVSAESVTEQILTGYFGVKQILVGKGAYNTAGRNITPSMSRMWASGTAYLALLADGESTPLEMPCVGRSMLWTERGNPAGRLNLGVETYREEKVEGTVVRVKHSFDLVLQQAVGTDLFVQSIDVDP